MDNDNDDYKNPDIIRDLELAKVYLRSGFLPPIYQIPEQVFFVIQMGREIGIHPRHALNHIYIVDGVPTMRAELMLFLIKRHAPRARVRFLERTERRVILEVDVYGDGEKQTFEWNWAMAVRAGLVQKQSWKEYPVAMLTWRCVADMARLCFPTALHGISHTPEELGLETNDRGVPTGSPPEAYEGPSVVFEDDHKPEEEEAPPPPPPPPAHSEEEEKISKLVRVLTSEAVGFQVEDLAGFLGTPRGEWDVRERIELENAVKQLKKSFSPQKNRELVSLFLGESL